MAADAMVLAVSHISVCHLSFPVGISSPLERSALWHCYLTVQTGDCRTQINSQVAGMQRPSTNGDAGSANAQKRGTKLGELIELDQYKVAVGAVMGEPLSRCLSLLYGNLQGNLQ